MNRRGDVMADGESSIDGSVQLHFSDTDDFYRLLREKLRVGNTVVIDTPFKAVDELPSRLDALCRGKELRAFWPDTFIAGAIHHASWSPNLKSLYVFGGASAGAVVGGLTGGPVGIAVGALIGGAAGVAAALVTEDSYDITFEIDPRGTLRIRLRKRRK